MKTNAEDESISSCPGKLRDVEVMCQENEAEGGDIIRKVSNYPKNVFFPI